SPKNLLYYSLAGVTSQASNGLYVVPANANNVAPHSPITPPGLASAPPPIALRLQQGGFIGVFTVDQNGLEICINSGCTKQTMGQAPNAFTVGGSMGQVAYGTWDNTPAVYVVGLDTADSTASRMPDADIGNVISVTADADYLYWSTK